MQVANKKGGHSTSLVTKEMLVKTKIPFSAYQMEKGLKTWL